MTKAWVFAIEINQDGMSGRISLSIDTDNIDKWKPILNKTIELEEMLRRER